MDIENKIMNGIFHFNRLSSFTYAVAKLWNDLPISLRVCKNYDAFKVKLKSQLFKHSYEELLH